MSKNTKNYMMGVAFGFIGMILYCLSLEGYEYIVVEDVLELVKQAALPFAFTELWVAITSEGLKNIIDGFKEFRTKSKAKRVSKKGAEA